MTINFAVMFALLWREFYNPTNWSAEAQAGIPFRRIHEPTDSQEAKFITAEHNFMKDEWSSARTPTGISDWKKFMTAADARILPV